MELKEILYQGIYWSERLLYPFLLRWGIPQNTFLSWHGQWQRWAKDRKSRSAYRIHKRCTLFHRSKHGACMPQAVCAGNAGGLLPGCRLDWKELSAEGLSYHVCRRNWARLSKITVIKSRKYKKRNSLFSFLLLIRVGNIRQHESWITGEIKSVLNCMTASFL